MRTLKKKIRSLLFALTLTAALILAFAVIGIAAPSKQTKILTDFQSASDNYVMEGNTVAGSLGVNGFEVQGKSAMFEIAATNGKNKYLRQRWRTAGKKTDDPYLGFTVQSNPTATTVEKKDNIKVFEYLTIDFDFMSETGEYPKINFKPLSRIRNAAGALAWVSNDLGSLLSDSIGYYIQPSISCEGAKRVYINDGEYEWNHFSMVVSIDSENLKNSTVDVYINGESLFVGAPFFNANLPTSDAGYYESNSTLINFDQLRLATIPNQTVTEKTTIAYDNVAVYTYADGYIGKPDVIYDENYVFPEKQSYAYVDGVAYDHVTDARAAMELAREKIEIYEDVPFAVEIRGPIKVYTNGFAFPYTSAEHYIPDISEDGVYTFRNYRTVTWHLGDTVYTERLGYGEIPEFFMEYPDTVRIKGISYKTLGGFSLSDGGEMANIGPLYEDTEFYITRELSGALFSKTTPSKDVVVYKEDSGQTLESVLSSMESGSIIKLLSDIHITSTLRLPSSKTVYFDLNGNKLYYAGTSDTDTPKGSNFTVNTGVDFYLYSSVPGGEVHNSFFNYAQNKAKGVGIVATAATVVNSSVHIGEVAVGGVTYSGDNLTTYSPCLVYYSANETNTVNIKGGSHYRYVSDHRALFVIYNGSPIYAEDARFISLNADSLISSYMSGNNNATNPSKMNLKMKNCLLYTTGNVISQLWYGARVELLGCTVIGKLPTSSLGGSLIIGEGTQLSEIPSAATVSFSGNAVAAKSPRIIEVSYVAANPSYVYDKENPQNSYFDYLELQKRESVSLDVSVVCTATSKESAGKIQWIYGEKSREEYWCEGYLPYPPFKIESSTDPVYVISTERSIHTVRRGEDVKYEYQKRLNLNVLVNITIEESFIYKVYIPKEAEDAIISLKLDGATVELSERYEIFGEEYFVLSIPLDASFAALSHTLTVEAGDANGNPNVQSYTLSVTDYAEQIMLGSYNSETKLLVRTALAYINAARDYFGTNAGAPINVQNATSQDGVKPSSVPNEILEVVRGVRYSLESRISLLFSAAENKSGKSFTVEYSEFGKKKSVTFTPDNKEKIGDSYYYRLPLSATDVISGVKISVGKSVYEYSFDNYIYKIKSQEPIKAGEKLLTLLYNIREYSRAAQKMLTTPYATLEVADKDVSELKIVAKSEVELSAAELLSESILREFGVSLSITDEKNGAAIVIETTSYRDKREFYIEVSDGSMYIRCAYPSYLERGIERFASEYITARNGKVSFSEGFETAYRPESVCYYDFGAVGDGVADDFAAIKLAHDMANLHGYKVYSGEGVFNVGQHATTVKIKTDVDWTGATFIVDDSGIDPTLHSSVRNTHIFTFASDHSLQTYGAESELVKSMAGGFTRDITNIGFAPGYRAMVVVIDDTNFAYNRYGVHATGTEPYQREFVVVEADGTIVEETKFLLNFNTVTRVQVLCLEDDPICAVGGTFRTIANQAPPVYTSYARGLSIKRSNVTIKDTVHTIEGEGETGAPYGGFISYNYAENLYCENLTLQGHKSYQDYNYDEEGNIVSVKSTMGTYDIGGSYATGIYFYNCTQSNFFKDEATQTPYGSSEYWGIMGTNYCKNMTYDSCRFSRLDAHAGVYNATIKNSEIVYISLIGGGTALIENTTIYAVGNSTSIITLRGDYGSTWEGDIILRDCTFINNSANVNIIGGNWYNWEFGNYVCSLPNLIVDNLKCQNSSGVIYAYAKYVNTPELIDQKVLSDGTENKNVMFISATVTVKNNGEDYTYLGSENTYIDSKVTITEEENP